MAQTKLDLIVEKSDGELWGRIKVKGNLIVSSAKNLEALKNSLKKQAWEFENVEISDFEVSYDLTSFFDSYSYLNISEIAAKAGINPSLMRQYAAGNKNVSADRVRAIERAIHEIGEELAKVKLHKSTKELT